MKGKRIHLVGLAVAVAMILPLFMVTATPAIEVLTEEEILGTDVAVRKRLVKTADNAIYLFDASAGMQSKFLDPTKSRYEIATQFMKDRNEVFNDETLDSSPQIFGPARTPCCLAGRAVGASCATGKDERL